MSGKPPTLLSDALLRDLMAAGQADLLVAVPTLNHAPSAALIARKINALFTSVYAAQRTVLLNADGGSTDGTQAAFSGPHTRDSDVLVTEYTLRTLHSISTPYHGVPGRGSALRVIFAAADLLNVRAVAVISPEATEMQVEDLASLITPALEGSADYVKPVWPRAVHEGPLVTQLARPLLAATLGRRWLEPLDPSLACTGRFARRALQRRLWDTPFTQYGLDPRLTALATLEGFKLAQTRMRAALSNVYPPPPFSEVFAQVAGSVLSLVVEEHDAWAKSASIEDVPTFGSRPDVQHGVPRFDLDELARAYRDGLDALQPLLTDIVRPQTFAQLQRAAIASTPQLGDAAWVQTVYDFVLCAAGRKLPVAQLGEALQPLYLGRLCSVLHALAQPDGQASDPNERLQREFEKQRPELLAAWPIAESG